MPTRDKWLDPVGNWMFEVDGIASGKFASVDGLSTEVEMIEYRVSDQPLVPRYRPGLPKHGRITLKKGFVNNYELIEWIEAVRTGKHERKDLSIELQNNAGDEVVRWNLFNCMPTKWNMGSLDGKGNEVVFESLELVVEEIAFVKSNG